MDWPSSALHRGSVILSKEADTMNHIPYLMKEADTRYPVTARTSVSWNTDIALTPFRRKPGTVVIIAITISVSS